MERLTEWNESSHKNAYYPRCFEEPCYGSGCKIKDCPFETAVCERLAAYEDTGWTPEMLHKLGDTVYFARANPILQYKVTGYEMGEASISQVCSKHVDKETGLTFNFTFRPSSIGKTVFLTREEAEKALREIQGKEDADGATDKPE